MESDSRSPRHSSPHSHPGRISSWIQQSHTRLSTLHSRIPYLSHLPLPCILIISLLILVNLVAWAICGILLAFHSGPGLLGTAALAYSLGLRHALDADHISAIDLMTRRLIATGQRPVTVGTFFSLGHSTIVIVTSIVVAATAAGVSSRFDNFSHVGGIIGTSVSAAFLIFLGLMNGYILYRLLRQLHHVIHLQQHEAASEAWKVQGGGCLFHVLKRMFKLIDRPWKMYPLGVLFGLGFDTSSEIALLGISSIQGARGTSIWLIMVFPVLFTVGMCLLDTADGALMMGLYVAPMGMGEEKAPGERGVEPGGEVDGRGEQVVVQTHTGLTAEGRRDDVETPPQQENVMVSTQMRRQVKDPVTFLYYSIILTVLTVVCAIVIGAIQLLSLILNTAHPEGPFWDGVSKAGDNYDIIGGAICGSFVVAGIGSVLCYRPWRRWVERKREGLRRQAEAERVMGRVENVDERERYIVEGGGEEGEGTEELEVPYDAKGSERRNPFVSGSGSGNFGSSS